jgi:tetratricopeptide (TPR) repeat protein/mono/diheme cytochrome c family protein
MPGWAMNQVPPCTRPSGRLATAARALLAGTIVLCADPVPAQDNPTFARDVAPILYAHCVTCHRPAEVGGFSLMSYGDARPRAAAIGRATRSRAMPPWKPDASAGIEFVGARRLDERDISTIARWVANGAPEGNAADLPAAPTFPVGWQLGQPDLIVSMTEPYVVPAGKGDILRNFVIPVPTDSVRYVRGLEFRPDNPRVVHHANIRVDRGRSARASDDADAEPGFDGRLSGGAEFPDGQFLGWTPGQLAPLLTDDTAWRLDGGSDLVVQLHLRSGEQREQVRVRIGLFFSQQPPSRIPVMVRLGRQNLDIPAGARDYAVTDTYRLPVNTRLVAIQPHAHYRAREVSASALLPDGTVRELLHIGNWDFDWQDQYRYVTPVSLPAGSELRIAYGYDNSASNPRNPDYPPRRVRWGQNSSDEMGDVWFQLLTDDEGARQRLVADSGRKVLTEDAVGFETLLEGEPANPRLHEAAAAIFLTLGQLDRGVEHLQTALRLNPRSTEAHYNLATALAWQGNTRDAANHLEAVLETDPDHIGAHVNLGALLRHRGDMTGATTHLQRALDLDPGNAAAHTNLGGILMAAGSVSRAVAEYRAALTTRPNLIEALTELAWTLATSPAASLRSPQDAIEFGERARSITGGHDARALDALAAGYASAGRYADATRTLDAAMQLIGADAAGAEETRRLLRERRALYASGKPYRDATRAER